MGFFSGFLTIIVFIFNFFLFLIALHLIYLGLLGDYPILSQDAPDDDDSTYPMISNVILLLSLFVGVIAFMGCYGVATDNKLYLLVYSTMLMVLIAIQLFIAFALHAKYESVEGDVGAYFTDIVKNYTVHDNSSHEFMHRLQRKYNCCGFESYEDWLKLLSHIPGSCCGKPSHQECKKSQVAGKLPCAPIIRRRSRELFRPIVMFLIIVFGVEVVLTASVLCIVMSNPY